MQRLLTTILVFGFLVSGFLSCKSTEVDSTGASVRYTVIISDQAGAPLDSAKVRLFTETDHSYTETTSSQGRVSFEVASEVNHFSVSRKGFWDLDTIDQVPQPADSADQGKVVLRILRFHLESMSSSLALSSSIANSSSSANSNSSSSAE